MLVLLLAGALSLAFPLALVIVYDRAMRAAANSSDGASLNAHEIVPVGIVALAVAMGIGRFAFTPLMPLMLRDRAIDAASGAEWAAANYAGYLVGAVVAGRLGRQLARNLQSALLGVAVSTVLVAFVTTPVAGAGLRFAAGVFSAWVLVLGSSWCLMLLARAGAERLGAWIYTGVGLGIFLAGTLAWLGGRQPAWVLWLELGLLAAIGTWYVGQSMPRVREEIAPAAAQGRRHANRWHLDLMVCYAAFGFGYIVPATFLPTLARTQIDNPLVFGLTWPVFGLASVGSVAIAARALPTSPRRQVWAAAQAIMAVGTGLPALDQHLWSLALAAVLVGGTFMVTTLAGLQLARAGTRRSHSAARPDDHVVRGRPDRWPGAGSANWHAFIREMGRDDPCQRSCGRASRAFLGLAVARRTPLSIGMAIRLPEANTSGGLRNYYEANTLRC